MTVPDSLSGRVFWRRTHPWCHPPPLCYTCRCSLAPLHSGTHFGDLWCRLRTAPPPTSACAVVDDTIRAAHGASPNSLTATCTGRHWRRVVSAALSNGGENVSRIKPELWATRCGTRARPVSSKMRLRGRGMSTLTPMQRGPPFLRPSPWARAFGPGCRLPIEFCERQLRCDSQFGEKFCARDAVVPAAAIERHNDGVASHVEGGAAWHDERGM